MADDPLESAPRLRVVAENPPAPEKKKRKPRGPSRIMAVDVITEDAIALAFTREYGESARYDHEIGRWAIWDAEEKFWQWDKRQLAGYWCRSLARAASDGQAPKVMERVRRKGFVSGVEGFCRMDPVHAVTHEVWDPDRMLLGCPGVTIDLRTGERRDPRAEDMITRRTAVAPDASADCPRWRDFIRFVTQEDEDLERFIQTFLGYSLTGLTKEHQMLFVYGPGGNGKSLLLDTVAGIMGGYAQFASMDTFAASKFERHSTDLAAMRGARLVAVSEVAQGVGWNETRLASLTGGDKVRARFMRQDEFEYLPEFKLMIVGNHKPELRNVNDAMRRRMNMVPFTVKPAVPDLKLAEKLKEEWPAILQWMIRGCLAWQQEGLVKPQVVRASTEEYFEVQDTFGQWLDECCIIDRHDKNCWSVAVDLYRSWKAYAEARADDAGTAKAFGDLLRERGHERSLKKVNGKVVRVWQGILLRSEGGLDG